MNNLEIIEKENIENENKCDSEELTKDKIIREKKTKLIKEKKIKLENKITDKESFNEYHKNYYHDNIKGCKTQCECGLMVDKFRYARHRRSKKHLKNINIKLNIILV